MFILKVPVLISDKNRKVPVEENKIGNGNEHIRLQRHSILLFKVNFLFDFIYYLYEGYL